jgi:diguanylate cyclase (GGDEF)-like protein/PAS domain S-box-containing protein
MNTSLIQQFQTSIIILTTEYEITFANPAFIDESGYSEMELLGKKANDFLMGMDSISENQNGETFIKTKSGELAPKWMEINHFCPTKDSHYIGLILLDVQMSGVDPLTHLPNRYFFYRYLNKAIKKAGEEKTLLALMYIDLDRFKFINDTLGHSYGDILLKEASQRLKECEGTRNMVARMGGDEFIYLAQDLLDETEIDDLAIQILDSFSKPFQLKELEIYITPSIGISIYPYDGDEMESLISNADSAMYRAKRSGRNKIEKAQADFSAGAFEKLMVENDLRNALVKDELLLYFQPQIDLDQNKIMGMEALIRWNHPELGIVPPAEFIPIAEESGLIIPIGDWVIREACLKIKEWMDDGHNIRISINLSAKQFLQNDLVEKFEQLLKETQIAPDLLEIEITESMIMYNMGSATDVLNRLKTLGVFIAIDDFGKGYSSLSYLQKFPLDTLKIDRSFIFDIDSNPSSKALTQAMSNLGHALDMKVIAEGVESKEQLEHIENLQCDAVQGFYFSVPLNENEAKQFIINFKGAK